jgi:peptidoglycan hydrolase-like protein with peptidoglycan-binding domain
MRDLSAGMNGPDVRALQEGLNLPNDGVASPIAVDGSFGPETDKAIRAYQAPSNSNPTALLGRSRGLPIFHLAVATTTIFGQKRFSTRPTLKDRVLAGFSPGSLQLSGSSPAPQFTPRSNTIIIPDDLREQMKEWSVRPRSLPACRNRFLRP